MNDTPTDPITEAVDESFSDPLVELQRRATHAQILLSRWSAPTDRPEPDLESHLVHLEQTICVAAKAIVDAIHASKRP